MQISTLQARRFEQQFNTIVKVSVDNLKVPKKKRKKKEKKSKKDKKKAGKSK